MGSKYFTIGMAGHIDHGKTSLTKALTNFETDRLKEEQERNISIELGYAPFELTEGLHASIIDVPGHERFIRQMIAGVAGIDLVILVIAADEGVMPQTKEHMEILSFLGIEHAIIAITKISRVDEELLELVSEDVKDELNGTIFDHADIVYVDSLSKKGIDELKQKVITELEDIETRDAMGAFRLPIDQVFSIQGQGTVVRGTVYEGVLSVGDQPLVMPSIQKGKVRQIQVHHQEVEEVRAGQRAAINIGGISKHDIKRGDVLVSSNHFQVTDTIDVCLHTVDEITVPLKQRAPIKLHVGTAEVMGTIVYFDRNDMTEDSNEILCQLRLHEPIVTKRGDRFILRRPTPVETLGGGWVIDPAGEKYRFGQSTIEYLQRKKEGTPEDRVIDVLKQVKLSSLKELIKETSLNEEDLHGVIQNLDQRIVNVSEEWYTLSDIMAENKEDVITLLTDYHEQYPLRMGLNKAEIIQGFKNQYPKRFLEFSLETMINNHELEKNDQFITLASFTPHFPSKWKTRMEHVVKQLKNDAINVKAWEEYVKENNIPEELQEDFKHYLLFEKEVFELSDKLVIHTNTLESSIHKLKEQTGESFSLKEAKDTLNVSRKFLIPFLELLDDLKVTKRVDNERKWVS